MFCSYDLTLQRVNGQIEDRAQIWTFSSSTAISALILVTHQYHNINRFTTSLGRVDHDVVVWVEVQQFLELNFDHPNFGCLQ